MKCLEQVWIGPMQRETSNNVDFGILICLIRDLCIHLSFLVEAGRIYGLSVQLQSIEPHLHQSREMCCSDFN